jgi:hypothetical protein
VRRIWRNARRFVEQECRVETMCEAYAQLYQDIAAQRRH